MKTEDVEDEGRGIDEKVISNSCQNIRVGFHKTRVALSLN
jgi:hypothetical protein